MSDERYFVDPAHPGILRDRQTDSMTGYLIGMRAREFARILNAHEPAPRDAEIARCTRSHPHENMSPACERQTLIARAEYFEYVATERLKALSQHTARLVAQDAEIARLRAAAHELFDFADRREHKTHSSSMGLQTGCVHCAVDRFREALEGGA